MPIDKLKQLSWVSPSIKKHEIDAFIKTNWCVITGGPSSGKSSVINSLKQFGLKVVDEVARNYINEKMENGSELSDIVSNQLVLQRNILNIMYRIERSIDVDELVFFDRAIPDGIAFYREAALDPEEVQLLSSIHSYKRIFLFEQIPESLIEKDIIRLEDKNKRKRLEEKIEAAYSEIGYDIIRVPFMTIQERVALCLRYANYI